MRLESKLIRFVCNSAANSVPSDGVVSTFLVTLPIALLVVPVIADGVVEPVQQTIQYVLDHHVGSVNVVELSTGARWRCSRRLGFGWFGIGGLIVSSIAWFSTTFAAGGWGLERLRGGWLAECLHTVGGL